MTSKSSFRLAGWLLAGLVLSSAEPHAANGFTLSANEETAIKIGMSASEVGRLLGKPARVVRYRNAPGPIWTYWVLGAPFGRTAFDVDFGPDNKVISAAERVVGSGSGEW